MKDVSLAFMKELELRILISMSDRESRVTPVLITRGAESKMSRQPYEIKFARVNSSLAICINKVVNDNYINDSRDIFQTA